MDKQIEITGLIQPALEIISKISNEIKNTFGSGLYNYLYSQTKKYYYTNTFLHRAEKVIFYNIYYPVKAKYGKLITTFSNLDDLFEDYPNIIISGTAGCGKTTLIRYIFLETLKNKNSIPILLELRHLNDYHGNLEEMIFNKILGNKIKPSEGIINRLLESGKFLFLLDGYDEINSEKKQFINHQIEEFMDFNSKNKFLITTRPGSGIDTFPRCFTFDVIELSNDDVKKFIDKIVVEEERKKNINNIIFKDGNRDYLDFLRNPLLLSMFILTFETHPHIPKLKSAFYRNVFDTLFERHDGVTKNSFIREKKTKLSREDFSQILCIFGYITICEGKYSFTEEELADKFQKIKDHSEYNFEIKNLISDLHTSISLLIKDGLEYHFPHRSIQEYFTALYIKNLPTEKKEKAYYNIYNSFSKNSNDYSLNIWYLSQELDEIDFTQFYLIPSLSNILEKLKTKDETATFLAWIMFIRPVVDIVDTDQSKRTGQLDKHKNLILGRLATLENSLIDFCDCSSEFFYYFLEDHLNELYDFHKNEEGKTKSNFIYLEPDLQNKLTKIIYDLGAMESINKSINEIEEKLQFYKNKILKKKKNIDDLLNI